MTLNEAYINNNEGNNTTLYGSPANITDEQEDKLADMGDQIGEYSNKSHRQRRTYH